MAISESEEITPDSIRERLKEIGERDSATAAEPAPDAKSAAPVVSPAADAAPAAAAPAQPVAPSADDEWWHGEEVSHTMLRNAKSTDVEKMFVNAQKKIKEQGEELKRRPPAAPPAPPTAPTTHQVAPTPSAAIDPRREEYKAVYYTNPERAAEIAQEWAAEAAQRAYQSEREQETAQQRATAATTAARTGASTIAKDYGIEDTATIDFRLRTAVLPELGRYAEQVLADRGGDPNDPAQLAQLQEVFQQVIAEPDNYRLAYAAIFGEPVATPKPTIVVPATPPRATPPHSMAPPPAAAPKVVKQPPPPTSAHDRELTLLAKIGNFDEAQTNEFKQRVANAK